MPGTVPELRVCIQRTRQDPWTGTPSLAVVVVRTLEERWLERFHNVGQTSSHRESEKPSRRTQQRDRLDQVTCFNEVAVL